MRVLTVLLFPLLSLCSLNPMFPPPTLLSCPTVGTNAYVLVTVTPGVDVREFEELLRGYGRLMPFNATTQIKYDFYFGSNYSTIVTTNNIAKEISVS